MKAERRHELQDNDLQKVIKGLPTFWDVHGNRILIGIILVAVLVWAIRWRMSTGRESARRAQDAMAVAREGISELSSMDVLPGAPNVTANARSQRITDVRAALEVVNRETEDRPTQAEALVARGDLNWLIANMPELPGAATQPALRVDTAPEQALKTAEEAYNQVLSQYADQKIPVMSARFGLAAIAENRGDWDKARQLYGAVENDPSAAQGFKDQAKVRTELLKRMQHAIYIAPAPQPATQPVPSVLRLPNGGAATQPAATPAAPAVQAAPASQAVPATGPAR
jgi:hypothetical protein